MVFVKTTSTHTFSSANNETVGLNLFFRFAAVVLRHGGRRGRETVRLPPLNK